MLQRALSTVAKDSFNLLDIDGVASPNDMFCVLANGRAGNCKIEYVDSEYRKFCYVLKEVALEICKKIAMEGERGKVLTCRVLGSKSKQVARAISKKVATSTELKKALFENRMDKETLFCAITDVDIMDDFSQLYISVKSEKGKIIFCEEGKMLMVSAMLMEQVLDAMSIELTIDLTKGNFASTSISGI